MGTDTARRPGKVSHPLRRDGAEVAVSPFCVLVNHARELDCCQTEKPNLHGCGLSFHQRNRTSVVLRGF